MESTKAKEHEEEKERDSPNTAHTRSYTNPLNDKKNYNLEKECEKTHNLLPLTVVNSQLDISTGKNNKEMFFSID